MLVKSYSLRWRGFSQLVTYINRVHATQLTININGRRLSLPELFKNIYQEISVHNSLDEESFDALFYSDLFVNLGCQELADSE